MQTERPPAAKNTPSMLQRIRQRFTSGRPRVLPQSPVGPLLALQLANLERDRISEYITAQGAEAADFDVRVSIVTATLKDADSFRANSYPVPTTMDGILNLADKLVKVPDMIFVGFLVFVSDKRAGTQLQFTRPFESSKDAAERLAFASLQQRFGKGKKA